MIANQEWVDIDLSALNLNLGSDVLSFELSSMHDGSDIARVIFTGLLQLHMQSALSLNGSHLPVVAGKVTIAEYEENEADALLVSIKYGFRFARDSILPATTSSIFRLNIEGGEIEIVLIALRYEVIKK